MVSVRIEFILLVIVIVSLLLASLTAAVSARVIRRSSKDVLATKD